MGDPDGLTLALGPALEDAGVGASEFVLVTFSANPRGIAHEALLVPPGEPVPMPSEWFDGTDELKAVRDRSSHRLVCRSGVDPRMAAPLLRHEIEHLVQWRDGGGRPVMNAAAGVAAQLLNAIGYFELPLSGQIYNLNPIELDANGAASRYVRQLIGDAAADELEGLVDPALVRRRPPPEPVLTLATRVACFLAAFFHDAEGLIRGAGYEPVSWFERKLHSGQLWAAVTADDSALELARRVSDSMPDRSQCDSIESAPRAWEPTKAAVREACDYARSLAGLPPTPGEYGAV